MIGSCYSNNSKERSEMKKIALLVVVVMLVAGVVYAKEYSHSKKAGTYEVTLKMDKTPVPVAENRATVEVKDGSGNYVKGADVEVYYLMTTMPAMNYGAKARPSGDGYEVIIKPTMPGDWKVDVKVKDEAGKLHKAVFEFKAE